MHTERNDGRSMSLYVNLKLCPLHLIDARIRKQQDRVDTWRKSGKRERLANRSTGIHQTTLHGGCMRERAEGIGGRLTVDSELGRGTRVTADLPIDNAVQR